MPGIRFRVIIFRAILSKCWRCYFEEIATATAIIAEIFQARFSRLETFRHFVSPPMIRQYATFAQLDISTAAEMMPLIALRSGRGLLFLLIIVLPTHCTSPGNIDLTYIHLHFIFDRLYTLLCFLFTAICALVLLWRHF